MKILKARLKDAPQTAVRLDIDFDGDWLQASAAVERMKRELLAKIRNDLHEKIATLSLDDVEFQIFASSPQKE